MKMEQTQCSETSAIKHHTPENNPKDYTQHSEQGESFKSKIDYIIRNSIHCLVFEMEQHFVVFGVRNRYLALS
jgi:hypothetical protein